MDVVFSVTNKPTYITLTNNYNTTRVCLCVLPVLLLHMPNLLSSIVESFVIQSSVDYFFPNGDQLIELIFIYTHKQFGQKVSVFMQYMCGQSCCTNNK